MTAACTCAHAEEEHHVDGCISCPHTVDAAGTDECTWPRDACPCKYVPPAAQQLARRIDEHGDYKAGLIVELARGGILRASEYCRLRDRAARLERMLALFHGETDPNPVLERMRESVRKMLDGLDHRWREHPEDEVTT